MFFCFFYLALFVFSCQSVNDCEKIDESEREQRAEMVEWVVRGDKLEDCEERSEWPVEGRALCAKTEVRKGAIFFFSFFSFLFFLFSCKCYVESHMQRIGFVSLPILMYLMNAAFRFQFRHFPKKITSRPHYLQQNDKKEQKKRKLLNISDLKAWTQSLVCVTSFVPPVPSSA